MISLTKTVGVARIEETKEIIKEMTFYSIPVLEMSEDEKHFMIVRLFNDLRVQWGSRTNANRISKKSGLP